jgi:ribosome biogenesis ATPase
VLFFDEIDALVPSRDISGNDASSRVVNTLLTELDGLNARDGIYIIAATNRPDIIDSAMLRPGRFDRLLFVGLPHPDGRVAIMRTLISKTPIDSRLAEFAGREDCEGFSGADLESLLRQAGQMTLQRDAMVVEEQDFTTAIKLVMPSVQNMEKYERMRQRFSKQ